MLKRLLGKPNPNNYKRFSEHVRACFAGQTVVERFWRVGPVQTILPNLRIIEVEPSSKSNLWIYISSGVWEIKSPNGYLEFMLASPERSARCVELMAMTAFYHTNPQHHLGLGHTFPIGESWWPASICDHFLVSHPYPFGATLEIWTMVSGHGHLLWLLPITKAERDFKSEHGVEALENRFEEAGLEYWRPDRQSIV